MTPDQKDRRDEPEDNGILEDPAADTTAIGVVGTRTSHVRVTLPRGYEDLDDDADVVDDAPDRLAAGTIVLELPGAPEPEDAHDDEPAAETGEIDEDVLTAVRSAIGAEAREAAGADASEELAELEVVVEDEPEAGETREESPVEAADESADPATDGATDADGDADADADGDAPAREPSDVPDAAAGASSDAEDVADADAETDAGTEPGTALREDEPDAAAPADGSEAATRADEPGADGVDQTETTREPDDDARAADGARAGAGAHSVAAETMEDSVTTEPSPEPQAEPASAPAPRSEVATTRFVARPVESKRVAPSGAESAEQLTSDRLLDPGRQAKVEPEGAWRAFLFRATGGRIRLGDSRTARARKELTAKIAAPLHGGARFVPVLSRKGGVGKTTVTTLLGMALADARDDRIVAVDANPDRGTLAERVAGRSGRTVRDVVRDHERIQGYADISELVSRDETRLDVLASDTDPHIAHAFHEQDYRTVADVAAHYYSIVLTDTGTGIVHSVMHGALDLADELVVVAGLSVDEARLASETLTWLEAHGRGELVKRAVVVLNQSSPGAPLVRLDELEAHFASRVRAVVRLPYDPALATGSAITFRELRPETRQAARELAARVVEGLRSVARHGVAK